jgi:hypothetical protein
MHLDSRSELRVSLIQCGSDKLSVKFIQFQHLNCDTAWKAGIQMYLLPDSRLESGMMKNILYLL